MLCEHFENNIFKNNILQEYFLKILFNEIIVYNCRHELITCITECIASYKTKNICKT